MLHCQSPPFFVHGGYLWVKGCVTTSCQDDHQCPLRPWGLRMMTQRDKVSWSPAQPFSFWRTTEHLFLHSVFTLSLGCDKAGVSGQHMTSSEKRLIGCYYPCAVSAGKIRPLFYLTELIWWRKGGWLCLSLLETTQNYFVITASTFCLCLER